MSIVRKVCYKRRFLGVHLREKIAKKRHYIKIYGGGITIKTVKSF